jgi:hypothetical protein
MEGGKWPRAVSREWQRNQNCRNKMLSYSDPSVIQAGR